MSGEDSISIASMIAIVHPRISGTAIDRELRSAAASHRYRAIRVSDSIQADIAVTAGGGTCAFQLHVNFSHGHVTDAVARAERLAGSFEKSYVLLVRPNTDALRNFQLQVSPQCDARFLMIPSEGLVVHEVGRISVGVLDSGTKNKRREYFRQVREEQLRDPRHRWVLSELLKALEIPDHEQEADLLLDTFGSIRSICLQPLSSLLADCPVAGDTARVLYDFFNGQGREESVPCALCPCAKNGCKLLAP